MDKKVAIVGAGIGGLTTAARLAYKGHRVEVYEKLDRCGGRCNIIEDKGFKFDTGPSFVLMPDFFQEVFSYCGQDLKDYLDLVVLDPSYKVFYPDGDCITVYKDSEKTKEELERIEKGAARSFDAFIEEVTRIYNATRPLLYKCFSPKDLLNPSYLTLISKLKALQSYWQLAGKFFKSDKLRYLFTFEAMFIGVSPFESPAFYSVISYTDHVQKIYHPIGGMYCIAKALEKVARKFGVSLNYEREVKNIAASKDGVSLRFDNQAEVFDKVVVNADYAYSQSTLLKRRIPRYKYSCSVYLMYLGLKQKVNGLAHHNLFFSSDLRKNLNQIFNEKTVPQEPSFYVHVPTVTDPSLAPEGKEILYVLVPVPNLEGGTDASMSEQKLREHVFSVLNKNLGTNIEDLIEVQHTFYPRDFITRYNIKYGATFGLSHNLMQSAFFRPSNLDRRIKNLYYTGASTQPGGGLPVVIASSRIVADLVDGN
ncbi:MAG: phytoene desaturase [Candidatus Omnitrophota bacterium]|nr:MAG: phytoene desaturase [Candidatus Omnitrophota bacterium]